MNDIQTLSNSADLALVEEVERYGYQSKPKFGCGIRTDRIKAQQLRGKGAWELSVEKSLASLERVDKRPSVDDYICILQKCRKNKNLADAKRVHSHICADELETHRAIGNHLVPTFVECGSLYDAQLVFDRLVHRKEYSWTSLIQGYLDCGELQHALYLFQKMREDCVYPSKYTFLALLKGCTRLKCVERGKDMHAEIAKQEATNDSFVGNALVSLYAKCGLFTEARELLDKLPHRDVVSWTSLMAGYVEHGLGVEALNCLEEMQLEGVSPNAVTYMCGMKVCGSTGSICRGRDIHSEVLKQGFDRELFVSNTLVDMYAKCGTPAEARDVFNKLLIQDIISWNALIAGYAEHGLGEDALNGLEQLQLEGLSPNATTFACGLKACGCTGDIDRGRQIHAEVIKQECRLDTSIYNTLVDMFAKCGSLVEARVVFDMMPVQDVVSWTALIAGYAEYGLGEEALNCLEEMLQGAVSPNAVTYVCSLKACGTIGAIDKGKEIHAKIAKEGIERNSFVGSSLVDMYAKCGSFTEAKNVFDKLPVHDVVSLNALAAGYAEYGLDEEALSCLHCMQVKGLPPTGATFVCSLKACGSMGAINRGREIHAEISKQGLALDPIIGNTLVDMYAKCGLLAEAWNVFDKLPAKDVAAWNPLLAGYARQGECEFVFQLFERMREDGILPDAITFVSVLTACSHGGLMDAGQNYFDAMSKEHGIIPTIEHHNCMIDLLGRAGQLDEVVSMMERMPFQPDLVTWNTMLGACQKWCNVELGRQAFDHAVRLDENQVAASIAMSNIYADAHMWEDVKRIEAMRMNIQAWKEGGKS